MGDFLTGILYGLIVVIILLIIYVGYAWSLRKSEWRVGSIAALNETVWDSLFKYETITTTVSEDGQTAIIKFKIIPKKTESGGDTPYTIGTKTYKLTTDFLADGCSKDCIKV